PLSLADLDGSIEHPTMLAQEPGGKRIALLRRVGRSEGLREPVGVELSVLPGRQGRSPRACTAPACTGQAISAIQWRPGSDEILFTVTDPEAGLAQSIHAWDVRTGTVRRIVV